MENEEPGSINPGRDPPDDLSEPQILLSSAEDTSDFDFVGESEDGDDERSFSRDATNVGGRERDRKRHHNVNKNPENSKKSRSRTRSGSRSRVLTEKVLFYEQVWQGSGGRSPSLDHLAPPDSTHHHLQHSITTTKRTKSERFLDEHQLPKEFEELERKLEEKRRRYRSGERGGSPFLEGVSLRRTPSREYFSDVPNSPSPSRMDDEGRRSGVTSPTGGGGRGSGGGAPPPAVLRKKTVSYEEVFEEALGDGSSRDGRTTSSCVGESSPSVSRDEFISRTLSSTSTSKHTVVMTKYETRSQVIPGRRSVKYEMTGGSGATSDNVKFRSRTPSGSGGGGGDVAGGEQRPVTPTGTQRVLSNKIAKYEFLGVKADAINRSRTPSGGGASLSSRSIGGASPRLERSSFGSVGEVPGGGRDLQQRKLIVTTTEEVTTFRSVRSPSSGIGSPADSVSSGSFLLNQSQRSFPEDLPGVSRRSVGRSGSGSEASVSVSGGDNNKFDEVEERILSSSVSRTRSTPDHSGWSDESTEFYSKYKSQIGSASAAGRFETDVAKSAKAKSAFFDSHIAEIRGKINIINIFLITNIQILLFS